MSSFIANESPPLAEDEPVIVNDGWFPAVDPAQVRQVARLDGTVTAPRLRSAMLLAMADVNGELAAYKLWALAEGHEGLGAVPGPTVNGESVRLVYYRAAITARVQAELAEKYRDFETTGHADKRADALEVTASVHWRDMRWAISSILGIGRVTVELI
ncbi:head completion/stabilization protein [Leptospira sp. 96542]|nr:head completion/stabilization protein [Leptospira sp. 96542]